MGGVHRSTFGLEAIGLPLFKTLTTSGDFIEDSIYLGGPDEWLGVGVPGVEETVNRPLKVPYTMEGPTPHSLLREFGEPTFNQIQPA